MYGYTAPVTVFQDLLYTAVPALIDALNAQSDHPVTMADLRREHRAAWDTSPTRGRLADLTNTAFDVGLAVRGLGLDYAVVTVGDVAYTVNRTGKISPCPLPGSRWALTE